jgi:uncharacterized protein (TIGR00297 family)
MRTKRAGGARMSVMLSPFVRAGCIVALLVRARRHNSLTPLGIAAAVATGVVHSVTSSSINLILLMAFFLTSTKFTKLKADVKKSLTVVASESGDAPEGEPRNHIQVLANSFTASTLILLQFISNNRILQVGVIAQYAAVTADTWSSELGILSKSPPILITTLKPCPKGTNGGISLLGLAVAVAGGVLMGLLGVLFGPLAVDWTVVEKLRFVVFIGGMGLFGSVLDSLLGAVLQKSVVNSAGKIVEAEGGYKLNKVTGDLKIYSGSVDILSNNQVNFLMAAATSVVAMWLWQ